MSRSLYDFRLNFELQYLHKGDEYKLNAYKCLEETHASIADFIGSKKDQTYFVSNFSIGIRFVLDRLGPGTNLLLIEDDYHSLLSAIEERDFNLVSVKMQENIESLIANALEKKSIDVLVLSIVQYTSGLIIDLDFIADLKNKYPELLIIGDATQFIGTCVFNFSKSPFDAIVVVDISGYSLVLVMVLLLFRMIS
jgi:selenocysteine lyase/cysteine desulfurase